MDGDNHMQSVQASFSFLFHIEWAFTFYYARAHIQCKWMMQIKCLSNEKSFLGFHKFSSKENSIQNFKFSDAQINALKTFNSFHLTFSNTKFWVSLKDPNLPPTDPNRPQPP